MQQKLVQNFFTLRSWSFSEITGKQSKKSCPKLKNMYITYLMKIFTLPQTNASGSFLKTFINFVQQ